jgi:acyl carrier protein
MVTLEDLQNLVGVQLGKRNVSAEDRLQEDLGAESADLVNIIAAAEDKYHTSFAETDMARIRTVRDIYEIIITGSLSPKENLGKKSSTNTLP